MEQHFGHFVASSEKTIEQRIPGAIEGPKPAGSVEEIGTLVVDRLRMMRGMEKTQTCVVFQTVKEGV